MTIAEPVTRWTDGRCCLARQDHMPSPVGVGWLLKEGLSPSYRKEGDKCLGRRTQQPATPCLACRAPATDLCLSQLTLRAVLSRAHSALTLRQD